MLVMATAAALTACTVSVPGEPSAAPPGASSVTPGGGFPSVLSTEQADSGRTVTAVELAGEVTVVDVPKPPGFRTESVVVSGGLGSFQVALPASYLSMWRVGTPPDELLAEGAERDVDWAALARQRIGGADPGGALRAATLDTAPVDRVRAVQFTLTEGIPPGGDALAELVSGQNEEQGRPVRAAHAVTVNGADGAYIEFTLPSPPGAPARVGMQVLIPDPPNDVLWGVTCDVSAAEFAQLQPVCAQITGTFRPLPRIAG